MWKSFLQLQELLKCVVKNWQKSRTREEIEIMHKFAGEGKYFTFVYTCEYSRKTITI